MDLKDSADLLNWFDATELLRNLRGRNACVHRVDVDFKPA